MKSTGQDSLHTRKSLSVGGQEYHYFSLPAAAGTLGDVSRLPVSLKVLLENVLRFEDGGATTVDHARAIADWVKTAAARRKSRSARAASCCRTSPASPPWWTSPPCAIASSSSAARRTR